MVRIMKKYACEICIKIRTKNMSKILKIGHDSKTLTSNTREPDEFSIYQAHPAVRAV